MYFLTAGESHGNSITGILEGLPAGFEINIESIINNNAGYVYGDGYPYVKLRIRDETNNIYKEVVFENVANGASVAGCQWPRTTGRRGDRTTRNRPPCSEGHRGRFLSSCRLVVLSS